MNVWLSFFVGFVVGGVATMFLALLTLHYTKIEASKKLYNESKLRDQNDNTGVDTDDSVLAGSHA